MLSIIRFYIIGFLVLSVVYVSVSLYSRAVRKEKLEAEWDDLPEGLAGDTRDAYIRRGMEAYDKSLRKRLILGVYVVPMVLIGTILYLTNYA